MMSSVISAVVLMSSPISMEFEGPLKDGLKLLAQKSGINLVVLGQLDEPVQLNLPNVSGEEALETIAQAYGLEVTRSTMATSGKMWVVRRASKPPVATSLPEHVLELPPEVVRETVEEVRQSLHEGSHEARQRAKEAVKEFRQQAKEAVKEAREHAKEAVEAMEEARKKQAEEVRERVQEAVEAERERREEAAEAAREQAEGAGEVWALGMAERERKGRSADLGAGPVTVSKDSRSDDVVAFGGPVIIEEGAVVDGDAVAFGGDVILQQRAVVEGDAVSFGGSVVRAEGAVVRGESVSMGGSGLGSTVARNLAKARRAERVSEDEHDDASGFGQGLAGFLLQFAAFFGMGFVMMMLAPQRMKALETIIRAEPAKNGLAGFLGLLAAVPLTVMLVLTLVGIPVAAMMWVALAFAVPVGLAVVANAVGSKLPTGRVHKTQALALALGLLALLLVARIPVLGPVVLGLALLVSMGAIFRTRFGQHPRGTPIVDSVHSAPAP